MVNKFRQLYQSDFVVNSSNFNAIYNGQSVNLDSTEGFKGKQFILINQNCLPLALFTKTFSNYYDWSALTGHVYIISQGFFTWFN